MDITTRDELGQQWDFDKQSMRRKGTRRLREQAPDLRIGSPMCTMFSSWQRINRFGDIDRHKTEFKKARRHMPFVCELYQMQFENGRLLLHEHPAQADSWSEPCVEKLLRRAKVAIVEMDQCQLGQSNPHGGPVKKPTRWMSNCEEILEELDQRCTGRGGLRSASKRLHAVCSGKTDREAAIYPFEMRRPFSRGSGEIWKRVAA